MLVSSVTLVSFRHRQDPVRMFPVKVGIFVHHLRFEPEAEFHSQVFDLFCQPRDTLREPFRIGFPVSKPRLVRTPFSKPSVIQDEKLDSGIFRSLCQFQKLIFVKIKISGFPVIDENGTLPVSPVPPGQPFLVKSVEGLAHIIHAPVRINHHRLRSLEFFAWFQLPVKPFRMNAQEDAGGIMGVYFRLSQEISAVNQTESHDFPLKFIGIGTL